MSSRLRAFAAGTLLVWVAAQVLCLAHCNFGVAHGNSEKTSCHAAASAHCAASDASGSVPHKSSASTVCVTLKSALLGSGDAPLIPPDFHLAQSPALFPLAARVADLISVSSRQAKPRVWIFTPEVCLGPAFRSLAPPALG